MNAIFTNTYTSSKEYYKEIYSYVYFKRPLIIAFSVIFWVSFFLNLALLIMGQSYSIFVMIYVPFFSLLRVFTYFRAVSLSLKREREIYKEGTLTITTTVTDECINVETSTGNTGCLDYCDVKKIFETKNLILIKSKAGATYTFDRHTFVGGTDEDFIRYIKTMKAKA